MWFQRVLVIALVYFLGVNGRRKNSCVYQITFTPDQLKCPNEWREITDDLQETTERLTAEKVGLMTSIEELREEVNVLADAILSIEAESSSLRERLYFPSLQHVKDLSKINYNSEQVVNSNERKKFIDCQDALNQGYKKPGVYVLKPRGSPYETRAVCDQGWTVIQRRYDGSEDFYRVYDEYIAGFGNFSGEFWLGLENIYRLTSQQNYSLRVDMSGFSDKGYFAFYSSFQIENEMEEFKIRIGPMDSGNYFDGLYSSNGIGFSARDHDVDNWRRGNCADWFKGGWWLDNCGGDLNRLWCRGPGCMQWKDRNIKSSVMRIKPAYSIRQTDRKETEG